MSDKIRLEYVTAVINCKCASVYEDWEEKYKDNQTVLSLISKLLSAQSDEDEGISEAMEELVWEIGGDEEASLNTSGEFTVDGEVLEDEEDEDEEKGYTVDDGNLDFSEGYKEFKTADDFYEDQIKNAKLCITQEHTHSIITCLEIDAPFDIDKLKYKDGWIEYDGESFESDSSEAEYMNRSLYVDGKVPGALDYIAEVRDGMILIDKEYVEMMNGAEEGTQYQIKIGRSGVRLERIEDEEDDE